MSATGPDDPILQRLDLLERQIRQINRRLLLLETQPASSTLPDEEAHTVEDAHAIEEPHTIAEPPPAPAAKRPLDLPPLPRLPARYTEPHRSTPFANIKALADAPRRESPQPASPTPSAPPPGPPPWQMWLHQHNLLPPSGEGNLEVQIGAWWVTRIGTLVLVIGIVFFGIYITRGTPPWVRLTELAAVAFALSGAGLGLERRYERFGAVVFGGGLALIFFTTFAAYAVPPVKVMHDPALAALLQFAAAFLMVLCALWRRSPTIATMAIGCGFVACFFSLFQHLNDFALTAGLILSAASAVLYVLRRWPEPYQAAVFGAYTLLAAILLLRWLPDGPRVSFWYCHGWLLATMMLYLATDFTALLRGVVMEPRARRVTQLFSSTAAVALGLLTTLFLFHDQLATYYFTYGILLSAAAVLYFATGHEDALMHGYLMKGSALFTMGLITHYQARTRWVALAVESAVLLFSARRSRLFIMEVAMVLVWFTSLAFFAHHTLRLGYLTEAPGDFITANGLLSAAYMAGSALLFCLYARWFPAAARPDSSTTGAESGTRRDLQFSYAIAVGLTAWITARAYTPLSHLPIGLCLAALALVAVAQLGRHWIPALAATLPFLAAHATFWIRPAVVGPPRDVVTSGLAVVALTIATATVLFRLSQRDKKTEHQPGWIKGDIVLHALWLYSLLVILYKLVPVDAYLFGAVVIAGLAAFAAWRFPFHRLADCSMLPLIIVWPGLLFSRIGLGHLELRIHSEFMFWCAPVLAFGYACAFIVVEKLRARLVWLQPASRQQWDHGALATLFGWYVISHSPVLPPGGAMLVFAIAAVCVLALIRWPGLRPALWLGLVYLACAHARLFSMSDRPQYATDTPFLVEAILVGALTLAYLLIARRLAPGLTRTARRRFEWILGALALAQLDLLFLNRGGDLHHYVTVCWGLTAIALFAAGLLSHVKPLRILGLAGLALCLPRVFLIDIQSTLYRIVAFVILGAVFLAVGFIYTKYHAAITAMDDEPNT